MDNDDEASARARLAAALGHVSSSSESEEEEEAPPQPERRGLLADAIAMKLLTPDAGMRVPLHDQCRIVNENYAFGNRRFALDRNNKDAQAQLLRDQEDFIINLLAEMKEELQPAVPLTLPSFLEVFKQIAIGHMRKAENERLINIGKDLYIMAGMMAGLFRADEEFRGEFSYQRNIHFRMHNFHKEAETFLMNEKIQETDRRQAEKRKMADDEAEMRKLMEAEERRREEEEQDEEIQREIDRFLDIRNFDTVRFQTLMFNGWTEEEAQVQCEKEARERRIESQKEVEIRSSPPRSVVDPDDVALDLDAFHLEEEHSLYTPRPCPDALVRPSDFYAMMGSPALDDLEPEDMEMEDDNEHGEEYVPPGESEQQPRDHVEDGGRKSRRDYVAARGDGQVRRIEAGEEQMEREDQVLRAHEHAMAGEEQQEFLEEREEQGDYGVADAAEETETVMREEQEMRESMQSASSTHGTPRGRRKGQGRMGSEEREKQVVVSASKKTARQQREQTPSPPETPSHGPRTRSRERREKQRREEEERAAAPPARSTRSRSRSASRQPDGPITKQKEVVGKKEKGRGRSEEREEQDPYEHLERMEVDEYGEDTSEQIHVEAYPLEVVDAYKPWLEQREMERMVKERMLRKEPPSEWDETDLRQEIFEDHVCLGDFEGAVVDEHPKIRVDYGVGPENLKPAIKHKNGAPALLTDLHADQLEVASSEKKRLLNLQRSYAFHPRKKVVFCDADDPKHQIRCYDMVAEQERYNGKNDVDVTDDGYDKFHLTKSMPFLTDLIRSCKATHKMNTHYKEALASIEHRMVAGDCHSQSQDKRLKNRYLTGPIAMPVTKSQDVIYTRESALMKPGDEDKEEFEEWAVSHRDYKILLAMKPMEDKFIAGRWLPELRLYVENAFGCQLSKRIGVKSVANSGLSHLVFADSLLDRVNTYRFPQSYFIIHQHPLTLSSSFRVLCNEIPLEKLMNIEWFIFAYGFDEIIFEGEVPEKTAERVIQHVLATMQLYYDATKQLLPTHRCTLPAKFRVFKLPTHNMDERIKARIEQFNNHLVDAESRFMSMATPKQMQPLLHFMFTVVDWETPDIVEETMTVGNNDVSKRRKQLKEKLPPTYRYNCIDSFAQATRNNCNMRTARPMMRTDIAEFQQKRLEARVHGLSEEEQNRVY